MSALFDRLRDILTEKAAPGPAPARGSRRGALTDEMGSTGLIHYGGILDEEWLQQLKGERGRKTYREMSENDPVIGAVLFAIEMLVRQATWDVEPASEEEPDKEAAEFLWQCMNDMDRPWSQVVSDALSMLPYGWAIHELVYKQRRGILGATASKHDDGKIGWKRIPGRGQDTLDHWQLSENEDVEAFIQCHPTTGRLITIPAEKFVHFKTRERRGPESVSLLRNAFRPWSFKKRLEELEAVGIERDMAGLPCAFVPPDLLSAEATAAERGLLEQIKKIVRGVKVNEQMGVVFPLDYDENGKERYRFELLSSGGSKSYDVSKAIERYDLRIAQTVLADFIMLGHEAVGSFALSSSKTKLFSMALGAWLTAIAETFNAQAVPRLFALNGMRGPYPKIVHGDIETPDLAELGTYVTSIANAGALTLPDDKLERHLRRVADLPDLEEGGWDILTPPTPQPTPPPTPTPPPPPPPPTPPPTDGE